MEEANEDSFANLPVFLKVIPEYHRDTPGIPSYTLEKAHPVTAHGPHLALSVFINKVSPEHGHDHSFLHSIRGRAEWFWQSPHILQSWSIPCLAFYKIRLQTIAQREDSRTPFLLCELAWWRQAALWLLVRNSLLCPSIRCGAGSVHRSAGLLRLLHSTLTCVTQRRENSVFSLISNYLGESQCEPLCLPVLLSRGRG